MTRVGVIAHPKKTLGDGLGALRTSLAARGIEEPLWREAPTGGSVPSLVAELVDENVDLLFVWGGDGTVQRRLNAVGAAPVALAIMPAGTANLLASNLGIPRDLEAALDIGLSGRRRKLDLGAVSGERFSVMAGVGFDAMMIRQADAGLKDRLGRLAYVATGVGGVTRDAVRHPRGDRWKDLVRRGRPRASSSATWATSSVVCRSSRTPTLRTDS